VTEVIEKTQTVAPEAQPVRGRVTGTEKPRLRTLLAIPLAYFNPRVGRSFNLILAVLAFLLYNNGLSVSKAWVQQGRLSFGIGVWLVHVVVLLLVSWLFARRVYMQRWFPRWRDMRIFARRAQA